MGRTSIDLGRVADVWSRRYRNPRGPARWTAVQPCPTGQHQHWRMGEGWYPLLSASRPEREQTNQSHACRLDREHRSGMSTHVAEPRILILILHFGSWPEWFPLFLETCRWNP